jgi:hypothetical protein
MTGDPSWGVAGEGVPPGSGWGYARPDTDEQAANAHRILSRERALELRRYMIQVEGILPAAPRSPVVWTERKRAFERALERAADK